ncbi:hypothetical protein Ancab_035937 [Ancistrocladus abbreviatus]
MGKAGLFDLERHFAFYGAYHSNPVNVLIHMLFVWPILFTALILLYFIPIPYLFNFGLLMTVVYGLFYVNLDLRAGCLAALLCFLCWAGACFLASHLGFSLAWKRLLDVKHIQTLICCIMVKMIHHV